MGNQSDKYQFGGNEVRIADGYIWSAIHYLDSPNDYREHLPTRGQHETGSQMILLDDEKRPHKILRFTLVTAGALICVVLLLLHVWT